MCRSRDTLINTGSTFRISSLLAAEYNCSASRLSKRQRGLRRRGMAGTKNPAKISTSARTSSQWSDLPIIIIEYSPINNKQIDAYFAASRLASWHHPADQGEPALCIAINRSAPLLKCLQLSHKYLPFPCNFAPRAVETSSFSSFVERDGKRVIFYYAD